MAGYSQRSLQEKLGIKPNYIITLINHPERYERTLGKLPGTVTIALLNETMFDFIQMFTKEKQELESIFPILKKHLKHTGMLWISWPKGSSKISTDLNEHVIRDIGLKNGLVDIKVIAVD